MSADTNTSQEIELVTPAPLSAEHQFHTLTTDEKLEAIYSLLLSNQQKVDSAIDVIGTIGTEVGPILESLQANPMFKMMGFGKKL